jgi:hypothetical protein
MAGRDDLARKLQQRGHENNGQAGPPPDEDDGSGAVPLPPLLLVPGEPYRGPRGVVVPFQVRKDGAVLDAGTVSNAAWSRTKAGQLIRAWASLVTPGEAQQALGTLLRQAAARLAVARGADRPPLRQVVADKMRPHWRLAFRSPRGAWSEGRGQEVTQHQVATHTPPELLDAACGAADAPLGPDGQVDRQVLIRHLQAELAVFWSGALSELPTAEHCDLDADSKAGRLFRGLVVGTWTRVRTMHLDKDDHDRATPHIASLASRALAKVRPYLDPAAAVTKTDWERVHPGFPCWWRVVPDGQGGNAARLAMHWGIAEARDFALFGVVDEAGLLAVARRFGAFGDELCDLEDGIAGVLSAALTQDALADARRDEKHKEDREG